MKPLLLIALIGLVSCGKSTVEVQSSTHRVEIENPLITFCERLHPSILYPDEFTRESEIMDCLEICSSSGSCSISLPELGV